MPSAVPANGLAQVNGAELGYRMVGEGMPLVLLHVGFGSVEMFGPNVDLLAEGRRVIGDADGMPPSHALDFFGLLGGGLRDASWDRAEMTHHRLAILE